MTTDVKMTKGEDTKFTHPDNVALLTALGWKLADETKAKAPKAKE